MTISAAVISKIKNLPNQQKRVADAMLGINEPVTTNRLCRVVDLDQNRMAGVLFTLRNKGIVGGTKINGKREFNWFIHSELHDGDNMQRQKKDFPKDTMTKGTFDLRKAMERRIKEIKRELRSLNKEQKSLEKAVAALS